MKRTHWPIFFIIISWVFGCMPVQQKKVSMHPEPKAVTASLLPTGDIDRQIQILREKLKEEDLPDRDKEVASRLLETYTLLRKTSSPHTTDTERETILRSLFDNLNLLNNYYFSKDRDFPETISIFTEKRAKIMDAYFAGDFKDVIKKCLELKKDFGPNALTPEIGTLLSLSLAREGMTEEAVDIGEGISHELETSPDLITLRAGIVEWLLGLNRDEQALDIYEKLTDDLDERAALIKSLNNQIITKREAAAIIDDTFPGKWPGEIQDEKDLDPLDRLLREADALVRKHEFDKARLLLIRHLIKAVDETEIKKIDQALKGVDLAEKMFENGETPPDSDKKDDIDAAKKLIEEEKFQEAIAQLERLSGDPEFGLQADALKDQAIERLINRDRNRAAKLFLTAKKAKDLVVKEECLRASYDILNLLIKEFPSSSLYLKLKSHLEKVAYELDKLEKEIR